MNETFTALITGASSDIGFLVTKALLAKNIAVFGHYNQSPKKLLALNHPNLFLQQADLRNDDEVKKLVRSAHQQLKKITMLINFIGPFVEADLLTMTPSAWRNVIDLNLNINYAVCHYANDYLIETQGQILNFCFAGVENIRAWPKATAYGAAKAALLVLTKSLAVSLAPYQVRVNAIAPGYLDLGRHHDEESENLITQVPLKRLGTAHEIVELVTWVLLESPKYMTGANLTISGGWEHLV